MTGWRETFGVLTIVIVATAARLAGDAGSDEALFGVYGAALGFFAGAAPARRRRGDGPAA